MGDIHDRQEQQDPNILAMLSDLARGQQQLAQTLTQMMQTMNANNINNQGEHKHNGNNNGNNGHNGNQGEGSNTNVLVHTPMMTSRDIPRPLMPGFLDDHPREQEGQQGGGEGWGDYLQEYRSLGEKFHASMALTKFCGIKYRNRPRWERGQGNNKGLQCKVGKLAIPSYDGSSKCTE